MAPLRGQSGGPENVPPTLGSLRQYIPVQVPGLRERERERERARVFDEYNDVGGRGQGLSYCFMTKDLMVLAAADMIERFMYIYCSCCSHLLLSYHLRTYIHNLCYGTSPSIPSEKGRTCAPRSAAGAASVPSRPHIIIGVLAGCDE